jgi:hypothetical protein
VYYTCPVYYEEGIKNIYYSGWTVEIYPSPKNLGKAKELRISSTARSLDWIKLSWYSAIDKLITWGPAERSADP